MRLFCCFIFQSLLFLIFALIFFFLHLFIGFGYFHFVLNSDKTTAITFLLNDSKIAPNWSQPSSISSINCIVASIYRSKKSSIRVDWYKTVFDFPARISPLIYIYKFHVLLFISIWFAIGTAGKWHAWSDSWLFKWPFDIIQTIWRTPHFFLIYIVVFHSFHTLLSQCGVCSGWKKQKKECQSILRLKRNQSRCRRLLLLIGDGNEKNNVILRIFSHKNSKRSS